MGFWANWKQKRKDDKKVEDQDLKAKPKSTPKPKTKQKPNGVFASALEESENKKYHQPIIADIDNEIAKVENQQLDDLIVDPHIHSQGFISPKQGVDVFVKDVVDNSNLNLEKKKKSH